MKTDQIILIQSTKSFNFFLFLNHQGGNLIACSGQQRFTCYRLYNQFYLSPALTDSMPATIASVMLREQPRGNGFTSESLP